MKVAIKRAYDAPGPDDGYRVLVDRLWPRGIKKENLQVDNWLKEVGPSNELRQWFDHDSTKFPEFAKRYQVELRQSAAYHELEQLIRQHDKLTLVYSAKEKQYNQAVVLQKCLLSNTK